MKFDIRTDLALEQKEHAQETDQEITGVRLREWKDRKTAIRYTEVHVTDEYGAKAMGKPIGTYLTLEMEDLMGKDETYREQMADQIGDSLSEYIRRIWGVCEWQMKKPSVLVVGLGNPSVTPDALGPRTVGKIRVTRHLAGLCEKDPQEYLRQSVISAIVPGVMAQTGMETAEILTGIIEQTSPDLMIVIDALAARSVKRLGTTIQLTDTGIHPGSGVGNHRHSLTQETMGIPVLAIGVPTVVGAAAIVHDTVKILTKELLEHPMTRQLGDFFEELDPEEQYRMIRGLLEPEFGSLYVTPPDIDERVQILSTVISAGIQRAIDTVSCEG